jgi:hypothetical protein
MSLAFKERAIILVKAFPQPSQKYEETVCCAGITPEGAFVRLYPVRYRHLRPEQQFDRWDIIEYQATWPADDWRPESRHVDEESISIVQPRSHTSDEQRVRQWCAHISPSLVALKEENLATHKSLGVIRPDPGSIKFRHRPLDAGSEDDRQLQAAFKQVSLLDEGPLSRLPVEYDFSYRFTCAGHKHDMKIHDWEVQAAYLSYKQRYGEGALDELRKVYEETIPARNLHLVMGTMKAHPRQFIAIGLLRSGIDPVDATRQASLL